MARARIASMAIVLCALCATAFGATDALAAAGKTHCPGARSAAHPRSGTRSFRQSHCPAGHTRVRHHGKATHLLFFAPHGGQCPDATLAPNAGDISQVRAATLCLVNRERAAHGERALHWNIHLVASAQAHTESMAFHDYFEHLGPGGQTPLSRMRQDGYIYSSHLGFEVGENIGWGSLWLGTPRAVVGAWMNSAGHRANILDGRFRDTGIGVSPHTNDLAHGQAGGIYTQDFGVIVG
jgi:uncharacterized protein YkwD